MADIKTTDLTLKTVVPTDAQIAIVSPSDLSQSPTGSDYRLDIATFLTQTFRGAITLASASPTAVGSYIPTESGTYTNFGSKVIDLNTGSAIIIYDGTTFSVQKTTIDLSLYAKKVDINFPTWTAVAYASGIKVSYLGKYWKSNSVTVSGDVPGTSTKWIEELTSYISASKYNFLQDSVFLIENKDLKITNNINKITPLNIAAIPNTLDHKTAETWYRWNSDKVLNTISIPLLRSGNGTGTFTQNVTVRVAFNNNFFQTRTITVSEINANGLNSATSTSSNLYFTFKIPVFKIKQGDIVYVGIECGGTDKMGFVYTSNTTGEWGDRYYLRSTNNISSYTNVPLASGPTDFALAIKFGFNDYLQEQVKNNINTESVISINSRNINSFIGGTNTVIDYLLAAKPRAKFAFISHHNEDGIDKGSDKSLVKLIKAQQALANYWGVPILRLDKKLGWMKKNGVNTLLANVPDQIHPASDTTYDAVRQIKVQCVEFLKQFFTSYTGKKVAWYGTSIPFGFPAGSNGKYPDQSVTELGGTILNKAVSGSSIRRNKFNGTVLATNISFLDLNQTNNYQTAMLNLIGTANEPDLFIFDFGINDWVGDVIDFNFDENIT